MKHAPSELKIYPTLVAPLRGGRGLKLVCANVVRDNVRVAPLRGGRGLKLSKVSK